MCGSPLSFLNSVICILSSAIFAVPKQSSDDLPPAGESRILTGMPAVGTNVPRKDAREKVSGTARYVDDLTFPGMLHARTIRSTIPRGRIRAIRFPFDRAGFTIVDHRDVPGRNVVALIEDDQPLLAERDIRHVAEPILLLA